MMSLHERKSAARDAAALGASILVVIGGAVLLTKNYVRVEQSNTEAARIFTSLEAPGAFAASRVSSSRMDLSWSYDNAGQTGFEIERTGDPACQTDLKKIATVGANARKYSSTRLEAHTSYCYHIRAYAGSGVNRVYSTYASTEDVSLPPPAPEPLPVPIAPALPPLTSFNFSLSTDGGRIVNRGTSVTNTITLKAEGSSEAPIVFSASGLPVGASASFSPASCVSACTTTLSIATALTPAGIYPVIVTGAGGGATSITQFFLTVQTSSGYRNILIDFSLPLDGIHVGSIVTSTILTQNEPQPGVHFQWQLRDPSGAIVQSATAVVGEDGKKTLFIPIPEGGSPGYWGIEVWFIGEGYYNDADRVTFPVLN
jgi:hypothetical protein